MSWLFHQIFYLFRKKNYWIGVQTFCCCCCCLLIFKISFAIWKYNIFVKKFLISYSFIQVETVGDKYMAVSGLPEVCDNHAKCIARLALDMMDMCKNVNMGPKPVVRNYIKRISLFRFKLYVHFYSIIFYNSLNCFCIMVILFQNFIHPIKTTLHCNAVA